MTVRALPVMLGVLAALAVAYRYYSAWLAAKVAALDDARLTPAHRFQDGHNFEPTNRWVLFGHHFAAISGAGPLIGPVLAIQFGYLPGLIWLVVGVCLAGATQDMLVLAASVRRGGRSLAAIARDEAGPVAGAAASAAILFIIVIALAGLGVVVVKALGGEEVPMKPGAVLVYPKDAPITSRTSPGTKIYFVPPGVEYQYGPGPADTFTIQEKFNLSVDPQFPLKKNKDDAPGYILPENARRVVPGSVWGAFTIACTIPIALLVGFYMYKIRPGKIVEASIFGAAAVLAATVAGAWVRGSQFEGYFDWSRETTIAAMAGYGFVAAVLPVWLLLCPRDYLSSFLKIGTIALLVVGVMVANPKFEAPAINPQFAAGGGPYFNGPIFPYVFICIMCGAISGFHALVASGTTPKMLDRERDVRVIGYGAMLMEGLVGVTALVSAASLPNAMYYDINIDLAKRPQYTQAMNALDADAEHGPSELVAMEGAVEESLHGRTGGAVTLAVGMSRIFTRAVPAFSGMQKYWYHFAIMFEALFILTTIDAGTRIGRFLLQEMLGKIWKPLGDLQCPRASAFATALVVAGWTWFIATGSVETIWPMFGMANQLLAVIALGVATTWLVNEGRGKYAPATLVPMAFVATTTGTAAYNEITGKFWSMIQAGAVVRGWLNIGLTLFLVSCALVVVVACAARWVAAGRRPKPVESATSS